MEVAARSYLAADVAVVGASVIAVSPVVPKPDVQIPIPHVSASVELAALENPLEVIAKLVQQSIDNAGALGGKVLADPLPILQQIFTNQMGNASSLAGALGTFIANTTTAITQDVPQQLQLAQEAFEQGHITDGLNDLVGAVLLPILGSGLSNLEVFQDIFNVIRNPVQNVLNIIDAGPTILLNAGIGPILVLSNLVNAVGGGAEGLIAAVQSGDPENVANAVIDGVAGLAGAAINSVIDPNNGLIAAVLNLRTVIAQALGAPAPAVAAVAAVNELPAAAAKTVTLSTAPTTSDATQTPSKADATTTSDNTATTSDKDAGSTDAGTASGSTDATSSSTTGADASSTATDSSTASGAESKTGTDATGKDDSTATTSAGKDDAAGKADASNAKGAASDSSSDSGAKADNGATKASGTKKDSGSGEKADHEKAGK